MLAEPNCYKRGCRHFIGVNNFSSDVEGDERVVCNAFPNGIPDEIAYGDNEHLKIHSHQKNRIVFEKEN